MNARQKLLKRFYPLFMRVGKWFGFHNTILLNNHNSRPPVSIYSLNAIENSGSTFSFSNLTGKKILIVNTASDCGYTAQLKQLQELQYEYSGKLFIIGFPSNDFKQQEKLNDQEIQSFCITNYGISFTIMKKNGVVSENIQPVYKWLTDPKLNGWNSQEPEWNFCKYLVDENGTLIGYFSSAVSPFDNAILRHIK